MKKITKKEIIKKFKNLQNNDVYFVSARIYFTDIKIQLDQIVNDFKILNNWKIKENFQLLEKSNYLLLNNSRCDLSSCDYYEYKNFIIIYYYKVNETLIYIRK